MSEDWSAFSSGLKATPRRAQCRVCLLLAGLKPEIRDKVIEAFTAKDSLGTFVHSEPVLSTALAAQGHKISRSSIGRHRRDHS